MRLVLRIPFPTPSLNEMANVRSPWNYKTTRERWKRYVTDAWFEAKAEAGRGPSLWHRPPGCKVRVTIERYTRTENALDVDNLIGGFKPVLDALKTLALVDDDKHAAIELLARQPKNPFRYPMNWTQITLQRLDARENGEAR